MDEKYEGFIPEKPWKCGGGHVLGHVVRNGSGIRQLLLYRRAVNLETALVQDLAEVEVMAIVEGLVMDVNCSECGCIRTWVPGEESIRRLLEGRK